MQRGTETGVTEAQAKGHPGWLGDHGAPGRGLKGFSSQMEQLC